MKNIFKKIHFEYIFFILVITFCLYFSFNFKILRIHGESMYPTYNNGNLLILKYESPKRDDIIVFLPNNNWIKGSTTEKNYVKRIIGMPNDKIIINNHTLTIYSNDVLIRTLELLYKIDYIEFIVPENSYFVLGDNRLNSNDSFYQLLQGNKDDYYVYSDDIICSGNEVYLWN